VSADPDFVRMCAVVLSTENAHPADLMVCRQMVEAWHAEAVAAAAAAANAARYAPPWSGVVLVIAWWWSTLLVMDRWASGRYLRRRRALPKTAAEG
jgi:hypothetical protein